MRKPKSEISPRSYDVSMRGRTGEGRKPTVGIDLILVLLIKVKDDLHGDDPFDLVRWRNVVCGRCKRSGKTGGRTLHAPKYSYICATTSSSKRGSR